MNVNVKVDSEKRVSDMRLDLRAHLAGNQVSVRAAAREMRVSFSALARFVRGQTREPTPHMEQAIQRFLGKDPLPAPCPCVRCQGRVRVTLESRVERLEAHCSHLEEWLKETKTLLVQLARELHPDGTKPLCQ